MLDNARPMLAGDCSGTIGGSIVDTNDVGECPLGILNNLAHYGGLIVKRHHKPATSYLGPAYPCPHCVIRHFQTYRRIARMTLFITVSPFKWLSSQLLGFCGRYDGHSVVLTSWLNED